MMIHLPGRLSLVVATSLVASLTVVNMAVASPRVKEPPAAVGTATNIALPRAVASAKFFDQRGTSETLATLRGKTVFIFPVLTLCGDTCPFTSGNALQLQSLLTTNKVKNVEVIGIDVDPYRDTVSRLKAYSSLIGANFQLWTEAGATTTPTLTPKEIAAKNPVGTGDINANLTAVEKFLGWTVKVVPQTVPPNTDWMAPHDQLSYDINHSDGFWVLNPRQHINFVSGDLPAFTGKLSRILSTFMGYKNNIYKNPVYKNGWTPAQAFQAIEWVTTLNG